MGNGNGIFTKLYTLKEENEKLKNENKKLEEEIERLEELKMQLLNKNDKLEDEIDILIDIIDRLKCKKYNHNNIEEKYVQFL